MRRILGVRPGITSVASLHLREEEDLLALARDHDEAYVRIVVPAKLEIAMQHVETQSFLFDLGVLLKTVWALTGGRFFPTAEHPVVADLRTRIMKEQAGFHIDS
jgi:lipopolysaccharide/colanic/teichoic acid biosynthesis glycosyltransferase